MTIDKPEHNKLSFPPLSNLIVYNVIHLNNIKQCRPRDFEYRFFSKQVGVYASFRD